MGTYRETKQPPRTRGRRSDEERPAIHACIRTIYTIFGREDMTKPIN